MNAFDGSRPRWPASCFALALAALGLCRITLAHADCLPADGHRASELTLPAAHITIPFNAEVGTTVGAVHAMVPSDLPFTCTGAGNARDVRVLAQPVSVAGLANVYATNVHGIGVRLIVRGGSFAGIDDGPRAAPYKVSLPAHADRLTGVAVDAEFVKTGPVQDGVLAAGKLVSVTIGGAEMVNVATPPDGIVFSALQCAPVTVGGAVSMGVGTMGAFSQESVVIGTGCNPNVSAVIGLETGYLYGRGGRSAIAVAHGAAVPAKAAAIPGMVSISRSRGMRTRNGELTPSTSDDTDTGTSGSAQSAYQSAYQSGAQSGAQSGGFGMSGGGQRR
ncbi:hypothetical protein [Paraburkholderia sp.]|uniref:hypothetical protein n=1 Tax=Paraburkholderia sp. TaxID=1926495 RepID=UPI0023A207CA|nr:hypothetical protein [Paraburkholderia sp.]MDE1180174.1 hypothetical protein [Paraburkholderia sp.]